MEKLVPGTNIPYSGEGTFSRFIPLIKMTDGLTLSQVCSLTGLESSTIQNWVKRKFVSRPVDKKYRERQLARILLISALRDSMKIDRIGELMSMVNGDTDDTSDDIISEEQMYNYLCEVIAKTDDGAAPIKKIPELVSIVTQGYNPPNEKATERLRDALTVMVCAYIAGKYKNEADSLFEKMKEK